MAGTRSSLFARTQPGGQFRVVDAAQHPGYVWWVNSATGTNSLGSGQDPDHPLASITYAFSSDLVAAGDVVYVMPGHAETVTNTTRITADIAGVTVEGLGGRTNRPTITFATDTTADINIDAANVTFRNLRFVGNKASLAAPLDVNAAGFTMEDCDWYCAAAGTGILITVITDAAADDMTIQRCSFNYLVSNAATPAAVTETSTECIRLVGADRAVIVDNYISGDFTTAAINGITTGSKDIEIARNAIHNIATENIAGIVDLVAACNGIIDANYGFMGYTVSLAAIIDPSSCGMAKNYFSNVVTEAAGLVGTASS